MKKFRVAVLANLKTNAPHLEEESKDQRLINRFFIKSGTKVIAVTLFVLTLVSCIGNRVQVAPLPVVETYTPISTITKELTPTAIATEKKTATTEAEGNFEGNLSLKPTEDYEKELEKYGYIITKGGTIRSKDGQINQEDVLEIIIFNFIFDDAQKSGLGSVISGRSDLFEGGEQVLEFFVDPNVSRYDSTNVHYLDSIEAIGKWVKRNRTYILHALLKNDDGEIMTLYSYDNYSEEEWSQIREKINKIMNNREEWANEELILHRIYVQ